MNCPACNRLLYSRSRKACGFCGAELPAEVMFSGEEIAAIRAEQAAIEVRRAREKAKEEEEMKERAGEGEWGLKFEI